MNTHPAGTTVYRSVNQRADFTDVKNARIEMGGCLMAYCKLTRSCDDYDKCFRCINRLKTDIKNVVAYRIHWTTVRSNINIKIKVQQQKGLMC